MGGPDAEGLSHRMTGYSLNSTVSKRTERHEHDVSERDDMSINESRWVLTAKQLLMLWQETSSREERVESSGLELVFSLMLKLMVQSLINDAAPVFFFLV
jgi:hypothetical protein